MALVSDFTDDYYHSVMKGVILKSRIAVDLVDIPIQVKYDVITTAWTLLNCIEYFPDDTIYLIVVDPGVGTDRAALLIRIDEKYFILPDNGIIDPFYDQIDEIVKLSVENSRSITFHGRDVFAPAVVDILLEKEITDIGTPISKVTLNRLDIDIRRQSYHGYIVSIDQFGNIITSLQVERSKELRLKLNSKLFNLQLVNTFANAPKDTVVAIIGSSNTVELVVNQGSAKDRFPDLQIGDPIQLVQH